MIPVSYSFKSLVARKEAAGLAALGIAMVVFVFTSMMMLSAGISSAMSAAASPRNTLVMMQGAKNHFTSRLPGLVERAVEASPGIVNHDGEPLVAAEVLGYLLITSRDHQVIPITLRGVTPESFVVHEQVKLASGRRFAPGADEVIVGAGLAKKLRELFGTDLVYRGDRALRVVGTLSAEGATYESEVWSDRDTVRRILGLAPDVSSVITVRTDGEQGYKRFKEEIEHDGRFTVEVVTESAYYKKQARELSVFITALALIAGLIFAGGAVLGAMTTMYAMVSRRQREIGTLRALGFEPNAILGAFVVESLILSLAGAAVGCVGLMALAFVKVELLNPSTLSVVVFSFTVNPEVLLLTVCFAVFIGVASGLSPALFASRIEPSQAMRGG